MQMNVPPSSIKLEQTLLPKKICFLHYQTLKLYFQLGKKIEKMLRALAFNRAKCLMPYVKVNSQKCKRKEARKQIRGKLLYTRGQQWLRKNKCVKEKLS